MKSINPYIPMNSIASLCGQYLGLKKVRPGREDDLSPKERKEIASAKPDVDLLLRENGTFKRQVTEGTWKADGSMVVFTPTSFGGETEEKMRSRTEEMGRTFTLGFVFAPFQLVIDGDSLVTPQLDSVIVTEFRRNW